MAIHLRMSHGSCLLNYSDLIIHPHYPHCWLMLVLCIIEGFKLGILLSLCEKKVYCSSFLDFVCCLLAMIGRNIRQNSEIWQLSWNFGKPLMLLKHVFHFGIHNLLDFNLKWSYFQYRVHNRSSCHRWMAGYSLVLGRKYTRYSGSTPCKCNKRKGPICYKIGVKFYESCYEILLIFLDF